MPYSLNPFTSNLDYTAVYPQSYGVSIGENNNDGATLRAYGSSSFGTINHFYQTSWYTVDSTATRNDFTGSVGYGFSVKYRTLINGFNRLYVAGNTQNHEIKIWQSGNSATPVAAATVLAASASDSLGYKHVTLSSPVILVPGVTYYILCTETNGGDTWRDSRVMNGYLQPEFTYVSQAYTTIQGTYPQDTSLTTTGYDTCGMDYKAFFPITVEVDNSTNGVVIETDPTNATVASKNYSFMVRGQYRNGTNGERYVTTINNTGNCDIRTNAYIVINGASSNSDIPVSIAGNSAYMLGIESDVGGPTVVIKSTATAPAINSYNSSNVLTFQLNYDGLITTSSGTMLSLIHI